MATTISLRLDDDLHSGLTEIARARGVTISALAREAFGLLTAPSRRHTDDEFFGQAPVPTTLTTLERQQLALLHRILARLVEGDGEDGDREYQLERAEILEKGYVGEYSDVFVSIESELSRRDTALVMDIFDMFHVLEWSLEQLDPGDKRALGDFAPSALVFAGFDANHRRESRLLTYARHLIEQGKWESLANRFDRKHDGGNSHGQHLEMYERMLGIFEPIWKAKIRKHAVRGDTKLNRDELTKVAEAAVHPSNRR